MTCQTMSEKLPLIDDPELSTIERSQIEAHLATCPDCTAELTHLRNAQLQLRLLKEVEAPANGPDRILQAIPAADTGIRSMLNRIRRGYPVPWGSLVAGAAAVFLFLVLPGLHSPQSTLSNLDAPPEIAMSLSMEPRTAPISLFSAETLHVNAEPTIVIAADNRDLLQTHLLESVKEANFDWMPAPDQQAPDRGMTVTIFDASSEWIDTILAELQEQGGYIVSDDLSSSRLVEDGDNTRVATVRFVIVGAETD